MFLPPSSPGIVFESEDMQHHTPVELNTTFP